MSVSGGSVTEVRISSLMPSTTYSIQVAAENSAGVGSYSDPIAANTYCKEHALIASYSVLVPIRYNLSLLWFFHKCNFVHLVVTG